MVRCCLKIIFKKKNRSCPTPNKSVTVKNKHKKNGDFTSNFNPLHCLKTRHQIKKDFFFKKIGLPIIFHVPPL